MRAMFDLDLGTVEQAKLEEKETAQDTPRTRKSTAEGARGKRSRQYK